jgi:guanylate kinase
MQGKFVVIFGPTGVGKGTLAKYIRETFSEELIFPRTKTTRPMRPGEESGTLYDFVSNEEFQKIIDEGGFIEWAEYSGNRYGTPLAPIQEVIDSGEIAFKELEVQGVRQLIERLPRENLFIVYIDAGSWDELEARIRARAPISDEEVAKRRKHYDDESASKHLADVVIENRNSELEEAQIAFKKVIEGLL